MYVRTARDVARAADGLHSAGPCECQVAAALPQVLAFERRPSKDVDVQAERSLFVARGVQMPGDALVSGRLAGSASRRTSMPEAPPVKGTGLYSDRRGKPSLPVSADGDNLTGTTNNSQQPGDVELKEGEVMATRSTSLVRGRESTDRRRRVASGFSTATFVVPGPEKGLANRAFHSHSSCLKPTGLTSR